MNKFKYLIFVSLFFVFLNSCGTVREGFSNPKKNNSDEFLVEKKSPLVMPPEFENLPTPDENANERNLNKNSLKELITDNKENTDKKIKNKNLENSILDKIKK